MNVAVTIAYVLWGAGMGAYVMNWFWGRWISKGVKGIRAEMKPEMEKMAAENDRLERMLATAISACALCKNTLGVSYRDEAKFRARLARRS